MGKKYKDMTFLEHLEELRGMIIKSVVFLLLATGISYGFIPRILPFLIRDIDQLVFLSPSEAFVANIKLAFLGGVLLSIPIISYFFWQFISAGLTKTERKITVFFIPVSFILFLLGAAFGYFMILPITLKFFLGFSSAFIIPMITVSRYISFVGAIVLSFGLIFELPVVIVLLTKVGILTPLFLVQYRKHAIVAVFVISALITPPDVVTQILMAGPLILLYEISIFFSRLIHRFNERA